MKRLALALALAVSTIGTSHAQKIEGAVCWEGSRVRITYAGGDSRLMPKEVGQVGCDKPVVSGDGRAVGWPVLVKNCCTSYPIPIGLVVLSDGRKRSLNTGQMVWEWRFVEGDDVAVLSGPTHGNAEGVYLFHIRTGKRAAVWYGKGRPPAWAAQWASEFDGAQ